MAAVTAQVLTFVSRKAGSGKKLGRDQLEVDSDRRLEVREEVVGGTARIGGQTYQLRNWSPNGFCIGPVDLTPTPGDRLDIDFTIPLSDRTLIFRCRTGVMRYDSDVSEIGGVFFDMPEDVQAVVDQHFDIQAPRGYGSMLFARLRGAVGMSSEDNARAMPRMSSSDHDVSVISESDDGSADAVTAPKDTLMNSIPYLDTAEDGCADSQALLGLSYLVGDGVPQDDVQAKKWLDLAAAQGQQEAIRGQELVAQRMSVAQIAEAERLIHEWRQKRA